MLSLRSFFLSRRRREPVLGGLDSPSSGNSCVSPPKAYNAASGLSKEGWAARLRALCSGIALTWAAKPSVRPVPLTPELLSLPKQPGHLNSFEPGINHPSLQDTTCTAEKFRYAHNCSTSLDAARDGSLAMFAVRRPDTKAVCFVVRVSVGRAPSPEVFEVGFHFVLWWFVYQLDCEWGSQRVQVKAGGRGRPPHTPTHWARSG